MSRPDGYDVDGYTHFIERVNDKSSDLIDSDKNAKKMPDKDMYEIDFNYIEKLNLNKIGNEIPSLVRNVWNVDRYMAYYWKAIMDADCILVWHQLWEYCDMDNGVDICYPKMKELAQRCSISKGTLISKIKKLEENNFLIQIHRLNRRNGNREDSPIFKLRRTIPLLSRQQYEKLNPFLKNKHDEYMEKFASDTSMEIFEQNGNETKQDVIDSVGDRIISKKRRKAVNEMLKSEERESFILASLPTYMKDTIIEDLELRDSLVEKGMGKPSADTYFKDTITFYDRHSNIVHLIFPHDTNKEFTKSMLNSHGYNKLMEVLIDKYDSVYDIKYFTAEQYIIHIMKGK